MNLNSPNPHALLPGKDLKIVILVDNARYERARDYGAKALHGEDAVDWQASEVRRISSRRFGGNSRQCPFQFVYAFACKRTHSDDRGLRRVQERTAYEVSDLQANNVERVAIDHVALGKHGDAP